MFKGYMSAVVSPFKNNVLDIDGYAKYIEWQIESGIHGIVVSGTTGESSALTNAERLNLVKTSIDVVKGRVPLVVGIAAPNTHNVIEQLKDVNNLGGIDAIMVVTPYYVKPSQKGIIEHYKAIAEYSNYPIIIYNNPGRACVDIAPETIITIAKFNNVAALKEASTDLTRFCLFRKALGTGFSLLSGNDDTVPAAWTMGANGAISVSSNVIPSLCVSMYAAYKNCDVSRFEEIRNKIFNIHKLMFKESSPAPAKYALSRMGFITDELRMPLLTVSEDLKRMINDELLSLQLV